MTDLRIPSVSVRWCLLAMVLVVPQFVDGLPNLVTVTEFPESASSNFLSPYNHAP